MTPFLLHIFSADFARAARAYIDSYNLIAW